MLQRDPDFIITIDGTDVRDYIEGWELEDKEEGTSTITVKLVNPDKTLSGKFNIGQTIQIRFGYANEMTQKASLPVMEIEEEYSTGQDLVIKVVGRDPTQDLGGEKARGNTRGKSAGFNMWHGVGHNPKNPASKDAGKDQTLPYVCNENKKEQMWKFGICINGDEFSSNSLG